MRYASRELSRVLLTKIGYKVNYNRRIGICRLGRGALEWKLCIVDAGIKIITAK